MRQEEVKVKITCDACGKEIERSAYPGENFTHALVTIRFDVWYQGEYRMDDFCDECNQKIIKFLNDNNMFDYAKLKASLQAQ